MAITTRPGRVWVSGVASFLILLGSATGALGAEASTASRTPSVAAPARRPFVPAPGQASALEAVSCPSPASCWAVGSYVTAGGAEVSQVLHWNGRKWSRVATPLPAGISGLNGVSCTSTVSCWAVGNSQSKPGSGPVINQVLHWNGRAWSLVATPDPGGTAKGAGSGLTGVRCASPVSCWAVGHYSRGLSPAPTLNQVLHWNGRRWFLVPSPDQGGTAANDFSELTDVRCTSPASCWAVGDSQASGQAGLNQVLHWNGRTWSQFPTPDPGGTASGDISALSGVACASPASCWAVGDLGTLGSTGTVLNQVLHWDGRTWSLAATPEPDGTGPAASNVLSDVACTSPVSCWAVGGYGNFGRSMAPVLNQVLRWNGRTWSLVPTPDPAGITRGDGNSLHGVRCTSTASCWAVGTDVPNGQFERNQALHWNGSRWSVG